MDKSSDSTRGLPITDAPYHLAGHGTRTPEGKATHASARDGAKTHEPESPISQGWQCIGLRRAPEEAPAPTPTPTSAATAVDALRRSPVHGVLQALAARVWRPAALLPLGACVVKAILAHLASSHDAEVRDLFLAGAIASAAQAVTGALAYRTASGPGPGADVGDGLRVVTAVTPVLIDLAGLDLLAGDDWALDSRHHAQREAGMQLGEAARVMNVVLLGADLLGSVAQLSLRLQDRTPVATTPLEERVVAAAQPLQPPQPRRPTAPHPRAQLPAGDDEPDAQEVVFHTRKDAALPPRQESKYLQVASRAAAAGSSSASVSSAAGSA